MQDDIADEYVLHVDLPRPRPISDGIPVGATVLLDEDPGAEAWRPHIGKVVDYRYYKEFVDIGFEGHQVWTVAVDRAEVVVMVEADPNFQQERWLSQPCGPKWELDRG